MKTSYKNDLTVNLSPENIFLPTIVGKGYARFWNSQKRYVVCKGSRASKKSKTTALWHIYQIMKHKSANALVIRKTERTLKDSCYADLQWAINRLGVAEHWQCKQSPLELIYKPTGQKIIFRGMDNPLKITSISVSTGVLCFVWIEECFEIDKEEDFNFIDESIRGELPPGLFKRFTLTLNPWSSTHWVKARFFDTPDANTLAITTNYMCNEWLDEADLRMFEDMEKNRPNRYRVAGLGEWGISEGLIFENWSVEDLQPKIPGFNYTFNGLDFGFTNPTALIRAHVDEKNKKIYVFDEFYQRNADYDLIAEEVKKRVGNEIVIADSEDPRSIAELNRRNIRAMAAKKGPDSVLHGIRWLQAYDIIIDSKCTNFIKEISLYQWMTDKTGKSIEKPVKENDHLLDALRMGLEPLMLVQRAYAGKRI